MESASEFAGRSSRMSHKGIGSSTQQKSLITSRVPQRTDRCPVEQTVSDQLIELRGILRDVTSVYFSGYPPTGGGDYHHISIDINRDSPLIRGAHLLICAITGRFVDGHLCFESENLRKAVYAFCDALHDCSDPDDSKPLEKFEMELDQLINYFKRVREALLKGEAVDDLSYCNEVQTRITSLIDILRNDICESFAKRENEIRREPGRSYRRPERGGDAKRVVLTPEIIEALQSNMKTVRGELRDANKRMDCILFCASNGKHGVDPNLGSLMTFAKRNMVEFGVGLISKDDSLSTGKAADLTLKNFTPVLGSYKRGDSKEREDLRQGIYRQCKDKDLRFKTIREKAS